MDSDLRPEIISTRRARGEPVQNTSLYFAAWDECIELQQTARQQWVGNTLRWFREVDRHEVYAFVGGTPVGTLVYAYDPWEVHVGPALVVATQYVLPEYRNKGISGRMMREMLREAKGAGVPTLAFTHRTGPWEYKTIYRRVK